MSKHLVIVESPTKAKTISKFLGKDYTVLSSFGHVRDLPENKMGVDPSEDFKPTYVVPERSKNAVAELKKAAKDVEDVILATDEDREGEAIAWHIAGILGLDPESAKRITFHEITQSAIDKALEHPRILDMRLVDAQQTRRILDRLVGYELSPFLWDKVRRGLSAGRVQSVALRLVVERERERQAFKIDEYWTIDGMFEKSGVAFPGTLTHVAGRKLEKLDIKTEADAKNIADDLAGAACSVSAIETKEITRAAPTPYTTSSLQIEANARLGMSAKQTMTLAQKLYETGRITYMRTDSVNLSEQFLNEAQAYLKSAFGEKYATGARRYKTNKKGAQEAHEAIRPTSVSATPESLKGSLEPGQWKLYDLIWRRSLASQMPPAILRRTAVDIAAKTYVFRANGSTVSFDGFMKVFRATAEKILPELKQGDVVSLTSVTPTQHFTEPPPRFSDATLVKALEEYGIGRPSTYAPTISTIVDRGYVERDDNKKLFPTDTGMIVNDVLVEHFPTIVDFKFTADMEQDLDLIAEGEREWVPFLQAFYTPFHAQIEKKQSAVSREDVMKERNLGNDPKTGLPVIVRMGRFGPYAQLGEWSEEDKKAKRNKPKSGSLPKGVNIETVTLADVLPLFELPRVVGTTEAGEEIIANTGRFGPYLSAKGGSASGGKAMTASLPGDLHPSTITEAEARIVLADRAKQKAEMMKPIADLGLDPKTQKPVLVKNGRFGPYVTDGETNVSVPKKLDPAALTIEQASEMLEKKRNAPPSARRFGKKPAAKKKTKTGE